jgi:hypothetical protein
MRLTPVSFIRSLSFALSLLLLVASCQKGANSEGVKQLQIFLTDGPNSYDAVNIDIQAVDAKVDTCDRSRHDDHFGDRDDDRDDHERRRDEFGNWVSLSTPPGVYDILKLRNGIDTLLASGTVNGTVRKIRITLGSNNTVVKDGVTYPLQLINPTMNYLYIRLHDEHRRDSSDKEGVWVDFDLSRSVVEINGKYYLRPVLRPFCDRNFAGVEGKVTPAAANARVIVYNSSDTSSAIPNLDGYFKVRGLPAGAYSVLFDAANGYQDTTINNVQLINGKHIRLPEVVLHQ